jgi:phage shock protein C
MKKLYRSRRNRVLFGVCGGLGEYFKIDPTLIRILFIIAAFLRGSGILLYLILAVVIPDESREKRKLEKERRKLFYAPILIGAFILFRSIPGISDVELFAILLIAMVAIAYKKG